MVITITISLTILCSYHKVLKRVWHNVVGFFLQFTVLWWLFFEAQFPQQPQDLRAERNIILAGVWRSYLGLEMARIFFHFHKPLMYLGYGMSICICCSSFRDEALIIFVNLGY